MQRSSMMSVLESYKAFYAKPMAQMVNAFLQGKAVAYEDLMRRVRHSKEDKSFLILFITTNYFPTLDHPEKLKALTPAELTLLGLACEQGWNRERNFSTARDFYMLAAKNKHAPALLRLGWLYEKGAGVERNYQEAKKYYQHAYDEGNITALVRLGNLYLKKKIQISPSMKLGHVDPTEMLEFDSLFGSYNAAAYKYFTKAAVFGNIEMAVRYTRRVEVPVGPMQHLCKRAAAAGTPGSLIQMGVAHIIESLADPSTDKQAALNKASQYFQAVADQGNISGLATMCWASTQIEADGTYCLTLLNYVEKFLNAGDKNALFYRGWLYHQGINPDRYIGKDEKLAAHYYRLAAESASDFDTRLEARDKLFHLSNSAKDPSVLYHSSFNPTRARTYGLAKEESRNRLYGFARKHPRLFQELAQIYKDTWPKIMMLFDPLDPSMQAAYFGLSQKLPLELVFSIFNFYKPRLHEALLIKSMMYDECALVSHIQSIISRKWIAQGHKRRCDTTLTFEAKQKYVKKIPASEKEKWEICTALRNGTALFSVKEGLRRVDLIQQQHPDLYPTASTFK